MTVLDPHTRGDPFVYTTPPLDGGWLFSQFDEVVMTFRSSVAESSVTDDTDAVDQAKLSLGEIAPAGDSLTATITIPSSRTTAWPLRWLYWDIQATILGSGGSDDQSRTIDSGRIYIRGDVTRSP